MIWRDLKQSGEIFDLLSDIWAAEESLPRAFRDANHSWTRTEQEFSVFVENCSNAYGLFDSNDALRIIVYCEKTCADTLNIHLSVLKPLTRAEFLKQTAVLRDQTFHRGIRRLRGWILSRNRSLCAMLHEIGFTATGISMRHGTSRGKVLTWNMVEAKQW